MFDTPRKLEPEEQDDINGLRDEEGNFYEVSEDYHRRQIELRRPTTEEEAKLQVAKELLNSKLKRLTERQRQVMYYIILNYSHEEIAKQLKISKATVEKHLEAARRKLAKYIKGHIEIMKEAT
jgi:RNA polymerase sigma factor (sigma-70 family)